MADSDNRQFIYGKLTGEMGLSPNAALGVLYSLGGESHYNLDPTAVGAGGDFGIAQWTGSRKAGLNQMAKTLGTAPTDPNTQWQFMKSELVGPYSHVLQGLQGAKSAADATNIWTTQYEAPAVNNWQQRYAGGSQVGSIVDGNFVPGKAGSSPNPTPTAVANATPGTTLNTTPTAPADAPSPASLFAKGDIGGGLQAMNKQGDMGKLAQAVKPQQQQITPMQAPNLGIHQANPQAAALLASLVPQQGTTLQHPGIPGAPLGAMGMPGLGMMGMGGMYPYGMMG